jgi:ParB family chromosome partitioning protein
LGSSSEQLGKENGKSGRQIHRYIRLTYLQEELLDLVDRKKITFKAAEKLSFLNEKEQGMLVDAILEYKVFPNDTMADKIKTLSSVNALDEKQIANVLLQDIQKGKNFSLSVKAIQKYFPEDYSAEDIEKVIIGLLEKWNRGMKNE